MNRGLFAPQREGSPLKWDTCYLSLQLASPRPWEKHKGSKHLGSPSIFETDTHGLSKPSQEKNGAFSPSLCLRQLHTSVGQNQRYHVGVGEFTTHYFRDWAVHWGPTDLDFDLWPHAPHVAGASAFPRARQSHEVGTVSFGTPSSSCPG